MKRTITVNSPVDFVCGFCGLKCMTSESPACVMHYEPRCAKFEELDPGEFLTQSRLAHNAKGTDPVTGELTN